jgi:putative polyketide hydroxylase
VGSSMVGMSLSIMLAAQGVKTLACERHASTAIHPRAAFFISRTIKIFRALGLIETILEEPKK